MWNAETEKFLPLESQMTRKKVVRDVRGGLPQISGGDKPYKNVDYMKDFFLPRGLIVGSTQRLDKPKKEKHQSRPATGSQKKGERSQNYEQKEKARVLSEEQTDVFNVNLWERDTL
jgi:hypothetical protein